VRIARAARKAEILNVPCSFCDRVTSGPLTTQSETAAAFLDGFPVSQGHTLVVPRRHVASLYVLHPADQADLWRLVGQVREQLARNLKPDGFNIGVNEGPAAGQTIEHAHIHVIPRWKGDVPDPRGGIRWVIPDKARYWE
jgi:diadenosine tetraphosphate (Ap4A) HIT family hydrolase